ncbi:hypothetical protein LINPERPRIM_LOCUS26951 [Linum perenne]
MNSSMETESMNGAPASCSNTNHDEVISGRQEEEEKNGEIGDVNRSAEEEEDEEVLRLKKLGDLIGPENLKALLDAEGGGKRNAVYHSAPNWRKRRWRRRRRKVKDSNSNSNSNSQIEVQQQPDLPLETVIEEKQLENPRNEVVDATGEDNVVSRKLPETAKEEKQLEEPRNEVVDATGEDNVVPRKLPLAMNTAFNRNNSFFLVLDLTCNPQLMSQETSKEEKQLEISTNGVDATGEDNAVLRMLLRRPRYFDPPDDGLEELCPLCGQDGHVARRCVLQNQKKPCFLCGISGHAWKHCDKSLCNEKGCCSESEAELTSMTCLRCREIGHDMLSCKSDYAPDDLKVKTEQNEIVTHDSLVRFPAVYILFQQLVNLFIAYDEQEIECYICKKVGHLCCSEFPDDDTGLQPKVTCYSCGESGHSGSCF